MANTNSPFGARIIGTMGNSDFNASIMKFVISSGNGTATFVGDHVALTGEANAAGIPYVIQSTNSGAAVGVVCSFEPDRDNLSLNYRTASTERVVYVNINYNVVFQMQTNGVFAAADIGLNAPIAVGSGNTTTGTSAMTLDISGKTASTEQVRILQLSQISGNEIGAYSVVDCIFNQHAFKGTAGV